MSGAVLAGGCHCGAVRYEAGGEPFHPTFCRCADCRRVAGAPVVAWFTVRAGDFRVVRGAMRRYASSDRAERGFCGDCGTPMAYWARETPDEVDVATATLDDPSLVPPRDHARVAEGIPWAAPRDGLPQFRGSRAEG